jgi:hypothetical protein
MPTITSYTTKCDLTHGAVVHPLAAVYFGGNPEPNEHLRQRLREVFHRAVGRGLPG